MSRANLSEMPVMSLEDGRPFAENMFPPDIERLFDYHLHFDVAQASNEAVDRLGEMWPIHRDRWLGHYGLTAAAETNERGREQLVVRDPGKSVVAKVPAGLQSSVERMWLQTNPALQGSTQTVDERFDENMALLFEPEAPAEIPHPKASLFRGVLNRLFGR